MTEFPAGIGHNWGLLSVTSARRGITKEGVE
jgi:hypothetical protein